MLHRCERQSFIGSKIEHLIPAAKDQPLSQFLEPFMSELADTHIDFNSGEVDAKRANGEKFIAELNASKLEAEEGLLFVISLRDVTGRREAEDALRENEERYRALVFG